VTNTQGDIRIVCLVLVGWRAHPDYRLIIAANRDEYYVRRSTTLQSWPEIPGLIAGRDLDCGTAVPGTWMGFRNNGPNTRFAAVTNVHNSGDERLGSRSRGRLARDFLCDDASSPQQFTQRLSAAADHSFQGYQLLISDLRELWWSSNVGSWPPMSLKPGFHAIANDATLHTLHELGADTSTDVPMPPKVRRGLQAFAAIVATAADNFESYLTMLSDRTPTPPPDGQASGLPPTLHRMFSARFVANSMYGTRSSTVGLVGEDGTYTVGERSFGPQGRRIGDIAFDGQMAMMDTAR
jgi:uncharacterized protein with NRDE domain